HCVVRLVIKLGYIQQESILKESGREELNLRDLIIETLNFYWFLDQLYLKQTTGQYRKLNQSLKGWKVEG
ncbi:hypothetical protein, partial [Mesobacillus sp.]|uniref:hypothetical protein n=1 Tax=Mesobacillus sp. TaxID=2675271 RepID=UPI0039EFAF69